MKFAGTMTLQSWSFMQRTVEQPHDHEKTGNQKGNIHLQANVQNQN